MDYLAYTPMLRSTVFLQFPCLPRMFDKTLQMLHSSSYVHRVFKFKILHRFFSSGVSVIASTPLCTVMVSVLNGYYWDVPEIEIEGLRKV